MLQDLRYDGVECIGEEQSIENLEDFKENLHTYGLEVSGVTGMWGNVSRTAAERRLLSLDNNIVEHTKKYVSRCIELCRRLDGKEFNVCLFSDTSISTPDFSHRTLPRKQKNKVIQRTIPILRSLAGYAQENGVLLLLEPLNRYATPYCCTAAEALGVCREIDAPSFGVLLDTFHMNIEEDSLSAAIELAGDFLLHLHFADNNRKMPGTAHLDFYTVLMALKKINYDKYVSFEPNLEHNNYLDSLKNGIAFIRELDSSLITR